MERFIIQVQYIVEGEKQRHRKKSYKTDKVEGKGMLNSSL